MAALFYFREMVVELEYKSSTFPLLAYTRNSSKSNFTEFLKAKL